MATYNGRRAPNVSEYIANLNTVPSFELPGQENINFDDDLALFTNTEFFDFDMSELPAMPQSFEYDQAQEQRARRGNAAAARQAMKQQQQPSQDVPANAALSGLADFPQFPDFSNFSPVEPASATTAPAAFSPVQQSSSAYSPHAAGYPASAASASPTSPTSVSPQHGSKRKLDALDSVSQHQPGGDENGRVAAEEDKRRRNTAASARFRVKKKQREQALEKTAKEMSDKVSLLESRVSQLEMENKWLKSLITEKNSLKGDFTEMYKKLTKDGGPASGSIIDASRSTNERTDGVGTKEEKA